MTTVIDNIKEQLAEMPEIERVILYGSRARADYDPRSDIDIAVECPDASHDIWRNIREKIENTRTLLFIDLIRLDTAPEPFRAKINKEGIVLYER